MTAAKAAIDNLSFEKAMDELESIVRNLESGKTTLEESISAYERGVVLKNHCEQKLREAQMKIEKIIVSPNGSLSTQPLDDE